MEITTKFNLGQEVYPIRSFRKEVTDPCPTCDGVGVVVIAGKEYRCPECYGSGTNTHLEPQKWQVINEYASKVGKVSVELYAERYHNRKGNEDQIRYMIEATGVGGGSLWNEDDLFATIEEAQAECERRNE